jgi:hypothetical protein
LGGVGDWGKIPLLTKDFILLSPAHP